MLTQLAQPETVRPVRTAQPSKSVIAWLWACLLLASGLLWSGLSGTSNPAQPLHASMIQPTSRMAPTANKKFVTKPIRDIRVGDRVLARNPEVSDAERAEAIEPDPATWRHVKTHAFDGSGPHVFEFYWAPLPDGVPVLIAKHDALLPQLIAVLSMDVK